MRLPPLIFVAPAPVSRLSPFLTSGLKMELRGRNGFSQKENYREEIRTCFPTGNSSHVSGPSARTGNEHHPKSAGARQHFEDQEASQEGHEESRPRGQYQYSKARSSEVIELATKAANENSPEQQDKTCCPRASFLKSEDSTLLGASPPPYSFLSDSAIVPAATPIAKISAIILEVCEKLQPSGKRSTVPCPTTQSDRFRNTRRL